MEELQDLEKTSKSQIELVVKRNDTAEEEGLDLMQVFANMGKRKRIFAWFMLICLLLGSGLGAVIFRVTAPKGYTSTVVTFTYQEARQGRDPKGYPLDITMIKSPSVVEKALEVLSWDDGLLDSELVRQKITITELMPSDIKKQMEVIETIAEKNPEYYKELLNINYTAYQYIITITNGFGKNTELTSSQLQELLDELIKSYKQFFFDKYADKEFPANTIDFVDYTGYDYIDVINVIHSQIRELVEYTEKLDKLAPGYRLSSTGMSFMDMGKAISLIEKVNLDKLLSNVYTHKLSKNIESLMDSYNYQYETCESKKKVAQEQLDSVNQAINDYKKDNVVLATMESNSTQTTSSSTDFYSELIDQRVVISKEIAEYEASLNKIKLQIDGLNEYRTDANYEDKLRSAEYELNNIIKLLKNCSEMMNQATEEFMNSEIFSNDYLSSISAQYYEDGLLSSAGIKKTAIGAFAGLFLGFCAWGVDGLVKELKAGKKGKENIG